MTNEDFLISTYRKMLETAVSCGYEFCAYDQIGKESGDRSCILRHDIDSELLGCGQMLDIERELGIKATYFVMTRSTAYNPFCVEGRSMVKRIIEDGHCLGLHFMGELCEGDDAQTISEKVAKEVKWLEEEFQTTINAVSFHQPSKVVLESNIEISGLINTYNKNQTQDYFYVSDTNMNWRQEHPVKIFSEGLHPRLQLLIHPMWWTLVSMETVDKWSAVLRMNRDGVVKHWRQRERSLEGEKVSALIEDKTVASSKVRPLSSFDADQTHRSFADKWDKNPSIALALTLDPDSNFQKWILNRNGFETREDAESFFNNKREILDAGCGNGRVTALLATLAPHANVKGVDLIDAEIADENTDKYSNVTIETANLCNNLQHVGRFDFIYCQEVLHHTGDARKAFNNLVQILKPGGVIAIYVYREKAPAREFMDDHVRDEIASLPYDQAMDVCRKISDFGRRLSGVTQEIEIEDIPEAGIQAGTYTPQRILYHFFMKCYWNKDLSKEENAVINYDWYHPKHCSRHTLEEVRSWFSGAGLQVQHEFQDMYGITVHGKL